MTSLGAEPRELQPSAVIILRIGVARLASRRRSPVRVAEIVANRAEREPGGGKAGRQLHRLRRISAAAGKIAARGAIERPFVAPVGDQVAGGDEQGPSVIAPFTTYLGAMRPEDILLPDARRRVLQARRLSYRSHAAGRQGADHPRPFRPCARRVMARCWPRRRRSTSCGCAMATISPGARRRSSYGETIELDGVKVTFHPAGHVLGSAQIAVEADGLRIVASGDYKDVADPTCAPFELVPCDVFITEATFGLPVFRHGDPDARDRKALAFGRAVSRTRASRRRLFARQGAARDRADPQGRLRQADLSPWRDGEDHALLREPRHRSRPLALVRGARKAELAGTITLCPPSALEGSVVAALSRSGHLLCLRLDARARPGAAAPSRIAAGDFRPRRLGRPDRPPSPRPAPARSGSRTGRKMRWCIGA